MRTSKKSKSIISKDMDATFKVFRTKLKRKRNWQELMSQMGIYPIVKRYDNLTRCRFIEGCVSEITSGHGNFKPSLFENYTQPSINVKSSIKHNLFSSKKGSLKQNYAKIFDTSMRKAHDDIDKQLDAVLGECGYDKQLMFYLFDLTQHRGMFFMTSLSEMVDSKYKHIKLPKQTLSAINSPENHQRLVRSLFKQKTAHLLISIPDALKSAIENKRYIEFSIAQESVQSYVERKTTKPQACLNKLK